MIVTSVAKSGPRTRKRPRTEPDRNQSQPNFGLGCNGLQLVSVLVASHWLGRKTVKNWL